MKVYRFSLVSCFLTFLLLSSGTVIYAASNSESVNNKIIYTAFIHRDMHRWQELIHSIETSGTTRTVDQKLDLINYYYGYIGYLLGIKKHEQAELLIEKGEKLIDEVLQQSPDNATAYSFKGSYYGFSIGINRFKAVYLESDSKSCVNKALELDPNNVQALIDKGNQLYYAPRLLGGNKQKALVYYLRAESVIERNNDTHANWVYINLLTMIASSYEKLDNLKQAKLTYEKILQLEPNITWVRDDLYPNFLARNNL